MALKSLSPRHRKRDGAWAERRRLELGRHIAVKMLLIMDLKLITERPDSKKFCPV